MCVNQEGRKTDSGDARLMPLGFVVKIIRLSLFLVDPLLIEGEKAWC
ncbi:hypothetical protein IMZ68_04490 [Candidatus Bathyarchaeota archaeon]|nr:hypothetical protein [Candidatus Bathyarchaeota archaeon]